MNHRVTFTRWALYSAAAYRSSPKPAEEAAGRDFARPVLVRHLLRGEAHAGSLACEHRMRALTPPPLSDKIIQFTFVPEADRPWIPRRYAQWLVGNERGCTSVCHCRPTARRARQALTVLRWLVYAWEFIGKGFGFCAPPPPPAEIDICSLLPSDLSSLSPP